jgi:hypothetical protein
MFRSAAIQFPHQSQVVPSGKDIHDYSNCDQCGVEPQRQSVRPCRSCALRGLELLQKEPEASHHKTESHQGQARANPRQESPLRGQIIAESALCLISVGASILLSPLSFHAPCGANETHSEA